MAGLFGLVGSIYELGVGRNKASFRGTRRLNVTKRYTPFGLLRVSILGFQIQYIHLLFSILLE